eukprot:6188125-Pleurochrysis_carterae.AAC.2
MNTRFRCLSSSSRQRRFSSEAEDIDVLRVLLEAAARAWRRKGVQQVRRRDSDSATATSEVACPTRPENRTKLTRALHPAARIQHPRANTSMAGEGSASQRADLDAARANRTLHISSGMPMSCNPRMIRHANQ